LPALIVVLLLLLAGVLVYAPSMILPMLFLASKLYLGFLFADVSVGEFGDCGESGL
jgi:hypothetical protein